MTSNSAIWFLLASLRFHKMDSQCLRCRYVEDLEYRLRVCIVTGEGNDALQQVQRMRHAADFEA
jgi:hypothetical protein